MKTISKEETEKMVDDFGKMRCRNTSALNKDVLIALRKLEIGQSLHVEVKDWHTKITPSIYVMSTFRRKRSEKEFSTRTLINDMGWIITREKDRVIT